MSNKDDPRFVKFVVRQMRAISEGEIERDADAPRWEREPELCSLRYPWLSETILEAFVVGIRRAYRTEHAYTGFEYSHLPNLLAVEGRAARQIEMLQLVNKEEDPDDGDLLNMSITEVVTHMMCWIGDDEVIAKWGIDGLMDVDCIVDNACDHLIDFLINLRLSIDGTFQALQEVESKAEEVEETPLPPPVPAKKRRERAASESGQLGAV